MSKYSTVQENLSMHVKVRLRKPNNKRNFNPQINDTSSIQKKKKKKKPPLPRCNRKIKIPMRTLWQKEKTPSLIGKFIICFITQRRNPFNQLPFFLPHSVSRGPKAKFSRYPWKYDGWLKNLEFWYVLASVDLLNGSYCGVEFV